jgi:Major tropism determinant N-terminal domain
MTSRLQNRRDTAANWTTNNPTLAAGEIGYETDTAKFKIGTGSANWSTLGYTQNGTVTSIVAGTGLSGGTITTSGTIAIDSTVATLTGSQTLTNKKLSDSTTTIVDVTDATKAIKFDVAGTTAVTGTIATAFTTAKTLTLPDATDTLVGKDTADTLTNKTLTTPVITNPKITLTYSAKTAAYTAVSGDEGGVFSMNNASPIQFNIPTDATFNFAIGTQFNVFWLTGAGQPTIGAVTPGTTTVISTGATSATPKLRVANSMATCLKIAANSWIVTGDVA